MNQYQIKTIEDAGRATTAVWSDDVFETQPHFAEIAIALLPATLILLAAAALLVALL